MHLYLHEFNDIKDAKVKEVRDLLFTNVVEDFQKRTGRKVEPLTVNTSKHGKPYFATAINMHFSITHSGRYWACMFDNENVGLDLEDYSKRKMTVKRFKEISQRFFQEDEQFYVAGGTDINEDSDEEITEEGIKNRFFRVWTAKEAYMKYTGNGFSEGIKKFSVLDGSLDINFRNVPVDPQVVLTYCSNRQTNLDELINI